jgi:hypothetical protein
MTTTIVLPVDEVRVREAIAPLLIDGEKAQEVHDVSPDHLVFTNRRLLLVDRQWLGTERTTYRSVPYRSITEFSLCTAGDDAELVVSVHGAADLRVALPRGTDAMSATETLARHVLL